MIATCPTMRWTLSGLNPVHPDCESGELSTSLTCHISSTIETIAIERCQREMFSTELIAGLPHVISVLPLTGIVHIIVCAYHSTLLSHYFRMKVWMQNDNNLFLTVMNHTHSVLLSYPWCSALWRGGTCTMTRTALSLICDRCSSRQMITTQTSRRINWTCGRFSVICLLLTRFNRNVTSSLIVRTPYYSHQRSTTDVQLNRPLLRRSRHCRTTDVTQPNNVT